MTRAVVKFWQSEIVLENAEMFTSDFDGGPPVQLNADGSRITPPSTTFRDREEAEAARSVLIARLRTHFPHANVRACPLYPDSVVYDRPGRR